MATALRAQTEAAAAINAKVICLCRCLDHYPITVDQRLCVFHSRFRTAERPVIPNNGLCADDHQLLKWDIGQLRSLLQNGIQDSFRNL